MSAGSTQAAVSVDHLSKRYAAELRSAMRYGRKALLSEFDLRAVTERPSLREDEFWALDDVTFSLTPGEALGVIGRNGAGKTTLQRVLHGLTRPDSGRAAIAGSTGALIELGASLDPLATGRESVLTEAAVLGVDVDEERDLLVRVEEFAELGDFFDAPIGAYSLGMRMRLAYAVAAELEPSVLLIDEILAVGDLYFQRKCLDFIRGFLHRGGSLVLVSHDLYMVRAVCQRVIVLDDGRIHYEGDPSEAVDSFMELQEEQASTQIGTHDLVLGSRRRHGSRVHRTAAARADDEGSGDFLAGAAATEAESSVQLVSAELLGADGGPASTQQPARVRVVVESSCTIEAVVWAFEITPRNHEIPILEAGLADDRSVRLLPGRSELTADLANLPVAAGSYHLRISVRDAGNDSVLAQLGRIDAPAAVRVVDLDSERGHLLRVAGVIGVMSARWTLDPDGGAERPSS